jgi:hypothetical protein
LRNPPPMVPDPSVMDISFGLGTEPTDQEPDPETKRKIDELANTADMSSAVAQARLKELVTDVVVGMRSDDHGNERARRVRTEGSG